MLPFINTALPKGANENLSSRFGVPVEKNVPLNEPILEKCNKRLMEKLNFWSVYPDLWAEEVLLPVNSSFHWMFYQRIILRQLARVPLNHITAARGVSKTFLEVFASVHRCIFCPNSSIAITAPSKTQAAQVAKQTFNDILARFPYLQNELIGPPLAGKDYFVINFKNGSKIEVTAALETTRGRRFDAIAVDETRDQQGDAVNSILVPTTSKVRLTVGAGQLNPYEMHQIQTYTTSASSKSNYNYEKALDILVRMIINPNSAWIMGLDYRVPVIEGIYPSSFVRDMRSDKTMNEQIFAREFLSIYTSENDEAWFNFNKLNNHRKIINAEWRAHFNKNNKDIFYLISVDIGRKHDNTVVTVFKVIPNRGKFRAIVVNIFILGRTKETKHFTRQVIDLKRIIKEFKPREVIIDINGIGAGIADLMVETQEYQGEIYEPLGFFNDDDYKKIQPPDAPRILYGFKANHKINSEMFSNCYSRIDAGLVDFLIKEQEARSKLLSTKKGQKMSLEQKTKVLMPYEMTTKLFDEIGNLRLKRTGVGLDIVLEPINSRFPDDRFSSLCIGLRRIKELEEEATKQRKRGNLRRNLVFFSGG